MRIANGIVWSLVAVAASCAPAAVPEAPIAPVRPAPRLSACALDPACTWPLVVAHRGLGGGAPENTLAGVRTAAAAGADAIEVDVRPTADAALVLMHDADAARTTDAEAKFPGRTDVAALTLAEIRTLVIDDPDCDEANADDDSARCRVGELEPLLDAARDAVLVMIDFKGGAPEAVAAAVRARDALDTAWFFDADEQNLARAQDEEPEIVVMPRAQSEDSTRDLLTRLTPTLLHADPGYQRAAAEAATDAGAKILVNVLATADLGFAARSQSSIEDAQILLEGTLDDGVMLVQTNFAADVRAVIDARMAR